MKFPFLFKATEASAAAASPLWPWKSCAASPKTLSFRASTGDNICKTYLDTSEVAHDTLDSFSSTCNSPEQHHEEIVSSESAVISGLRSDRLFFEPGETNSILEEARNTRESLHKEDVFTMEIDSSDPFLDFRASMEEMVEANHGVKNWKFLQDLLECYLTVNDGRHYRYIIGAFIDLLIHLALTPTSHDSAIDENCSSSSTTTTTTTHYSFTSPLSFSSSITYSSASPSCLSSLKNEDGIVAEEKGDCSSSSLSFNA